MNDPYTSKPYSKIAILKLVLLMSAIACLFTVPDVIIHYIAVIAHTFYESISFLIEEFLRHSFGFSKNVAQLIVFYFNMAIGIFFIFLFWKQVPAIINWLIDYLIVQLYIVKLKAMYLWHSLRTDQKIKFILIQSTVMMSAAMFLLT